MPYAFYNNFPPIFLLILYFSTYFIYVYYFCLDAAAVTVLHNRIIFLILLNIISVMFLWSFFSTMYSSVGRIPIEYKFTRNEHNLLIRARTDDEKDDILEGFSERKNLMLNTCTPTGSIRYCINCRQIKPDRTHHCTNCESCFLKMDHHCPWLNNCIGFKNYKSFLLVIFYTFLYCFLYCSTTIRYIIFTIDYSEYTQGLPITIGFGFAMIMGLVTFGFFCYHLYLIGNNESTLESIHAPCFVEDDLTFDLGVQQNFREVFGNRWYLWFIPVFSSMGCGHMFLVERK